MNRHILYAFYQCETDENASSEISELTTFHSPRYNNNNNFVPINNIILSIIRYYITIKIKLIYKIEETN